jgi:hypothetical protein
VKLNLLRKNRLNASCLAVPCLIFLGMMVQAQSSPEKTCSFDPQPWLQDFAQLTAEMSAHYSDLDYAVEGRHMDLPSLRRETEAKLGSSCNEQEARKVLESFLNSFGDGHLHSDWSKPGAQPSRATSISQISLCTRLGYKKQVLNPGIDFSQLPQFKSIAGEGADLFPGGILRSSEKTYLGVIRIPVFSEKAFPDVCEQITGEMHLDDSAHCDSECEHKISIETSNRLTAAIVRRSAQLRSEGASAILVDLTHNDGGSDWVDAVVRSLGPSPLVESDWGFIKHEHWTKELEQRLSDVEADLRNDRDSEKLKEAAARLKSGITRSQEKCDRSNVWDDNKLTCSIVIRGLIYSTGILAYAAPGSFAELKSKTVLFRPLRYSYTESSPRLPLYVVVDAHTWSSAEYFAFLLQDNGAATVIGEVTGGAGCGFTNGGIPTVLKNSQATVKMPDCVHFRKDGMNANAGVTPDILVPWSGHDNSYLKAEKLFRSLVSVVVPDSKEVVHEAH